MNLLYKKGSGGCGDVGGFYAWKHIRFTMAATSAVYTTKYSIVGTNTSVSSANTGGTMYIDGTTTGWNASLSGFGESKITGIGPNGELSDFTLWTSPVYLPYEC